MNLHSFNCDAAPGPTGIPDAKKGNSQLFFRLKKPVMFLGSDSPIFIKRNKKKKRTTNTSNRFYIDKKKKIERDI